MLHGSFGSGGVEGGVNNLVGSIIGRRELTEYGGHVVVIILEHGIAFDGQRAEFAARPLAIFGNPSSQVKSGFVDINVVRQAGDAAGWVFTKSSQKLREQIDAPDVGVGSRKQRGGGKVLTEEHVWVAMNDFATNQEIKCEQAKAFDTHVEMICQGKIVAANVIKADD